MAETLDETSRARFRRLAEALPTTVPPEDVVEVLEALTFAVASSAETETP